MSENVIKKKDWKKSLKKPPKKTYIVTNWHATPNTHWHATLNIGQESIFAVKQRFLMTCKFFHDI